MHPQSNRRGPRPKPAADRFWPKVKKNGPVPEQRPDLGPCWVWDAAISADTEYGSFTAEGHKRIGAHVFSYVLHYGPVPDGLEVDHLCRNRQCVNPTHLEAVTHQENVLRGAHGQLITHCPQGHPYDESNTIYSSGARKCRICTNARRAALAKANREKENERLRKWRATNRDERNAQRRAKRAEAKAISTSAAGADGRGR